jgi:NADH:ubiquinone oxidoreductase subunit K
MALLIIAIIAAEAALFLAMIIHLYKEIRTIDADEFNQLSEAEQC